LIQDQNGASLMVPAKISSLLRVRNPDPLLSQSATAAEARMARMHSDGALGDVVAKRTKRTARVRTKKVRMIVSLAMMKRTANAREARKTRKPNARQAKARKTRKRANANGLSSKSQEDGDPGTAALSTTKARRQQEQDSVPTASLTQRRTAGDRSATWMALETRIRSFVTSLPLRPGRRRQLSRCAGKTRRSQDVKLRRKTMTLMVSDSS